MAGLFGSRPRGWTPPINPQLGVDIARENGILPGDQRGLPQMPQAPAKKPGLFGQGGVGRYMAGAIGDALLQNAGMQPIHAPAVQQAQQMAERQRQASLERDASWQDWLRKKEWERANPAASDPWIQTEDNAGNVHLVNRDTGEQRTVFVDPNDKVIVQDGQLITVPNVVRAGPSEQRQTIAGKTYVKRGNDWFEEGGPASAPGNFPQADY